MAACPKRQQSARGRLCCVAWKRNPLCVGLFFCFTKATAFYYEALFGTAIVVTAKNGQLSHVTRGFALLMRIGTKTSGTCLHNLLFYVPCSLHVRHAVRKSRSTDVAAAVHEAPHSTLRGQRTCMAEKYVYEHRKALLSSSARMAGQTCGDCRSSGNKNRAEASG
ncbi:hypothetical protein TRVL_08082 [Trypanosoma vivax]|nr:hypothetical protein TRVL_08082 [Trypanosoma vivax]